MREQSRSSVRAQQEWLEANENLSERSEKLSPPGAVGVAVLPPEPVVVAAPAPLYGRNDPIAPPLAEAAAADDGGSTSASCTNPAEERIEA